MDTKGCNCAHEAGSQTIPGHELMNYRNDTERTIEGDLFGAFVRAGAISKANADDAKKSSLVRCARTDKGVHAAGNIISLKLITEDPEIVSKINTHLSPQIRVFGISRVNGSFSAYHLCDSRVYEYLIPTHCFLPPHPDSFLAKKLLELANEAGDLEGYQTRQAEASTFWTAAEQEYINPLLESIPPNLLPLIQKALYQPTDVADSEASSLEGHSIPVTLKDSFDVSNNPSSLGNAHAVPSIPRNAEPIIKELRTAHLLAKQAYRISPARMERICATVNLFVGTHSFHNYTLHKKFRDPSASRVIKSIALDPHPRIVNGTEWVSIKLHGQSFMMHQIRKMVSMAAMVVRCGAEPHKVIPPSFGRDRLSIPKAPGLGLLLERPIFDAFNEKKLVGEFRREPVGFTKYEAEMKEFKRREIYDRIWREEAEGNIFHSYFASVDNLRTSQMLYLSSMGIKAAVRGLEGDRETNAADGAMAQAAIVCEDSEEEVDGAIDG